MRLGYLGFIQPEAENQNQSARPEVGQLQKQPYNQQQNWESALSIFKKSIFLLFSL